MRVIDLLNKIANGEEMPLRIKYYKDIWLWDSTEQDFVFNYKRLFNYYLKENILSSLNDEIEIIEEDKKIEPIKYEVNTIIGISDCVEKINEIIKHINNGD